MTSSIEGILADLADPGLRRRKTVRLQINRAGVDFDELHAAHASAEADLLSAWDDSADGGDESKRVEFAQRVVDIEQRIEDAKTPFAVASIGKRKWADLIAQHPPTADDRRVDPRAQVNALTHPPAALAASAVEPTLTVEQAVQLMDTLDDTQWDILFGAVLEVNLGGAASPKSLLAGSILRTSERSATTAASEGSPGLSSLAAS